MVKQGLDVTEAIQVSFGLNVNNRQREYQGLQEAMSVHHLNEGLLLTNSIDESLNPSPAGIRAVPVWQWLLKK